MSQVGVFAALVTPKVNTWIAGARFVPESWFADDQAAKRTKVGLPKDRPFQTKVERAWQIIQRLPKKGIPFDGVAMDALYGRNQHLRKNLAEAGIAYYADVPENTVMSLDKPQIIYPITNQGKPSKKDQVVASHRYPASELLHHPDLDRAEITLRPNERDQLRAKFARCQVWLVYQGECRQEWLLIRQDAKRITYPLSKAAPTTLLQTMAWRKSHRSFIERRNQDQEGELGWDEFQAIKYLAWQHQLALTILASWFIALTRLDWMQRFARDPGLLAQYEIEVLPFFSVRNVRELLRAAMPLPKLSVQDAANLVIENLVNRTRSRKSRLRKSRQTSAAT